MQLPSQPQIPVNVNEPSQFCQCGPVDLLKKACSRKQEPQQTILSWFEGSRMLLQKILTILPKSEQLQDDGSCNPKQCSKGKQSVPVDAVLNL